MPSGSYVFPEPVKALVGMRRVVKPGSRVVALVWSSPEKNPYQALPLAIVRRIGNMPFPGAGQPGMFTLGEPSTLEGVFRAAGFLDIAIQPVPLVRRYTLTAEAVRRIELPIFRQLIAKLSDTERENALAEIEREFSPFQGPNGVEFASEFLIAVGIK
jgi:hypothetical protein